MKVKNFESRQIPRGGASNFQSRKGGRVKCLGGEGRGRGVAERGRKIGGGEFGGP